MTDWSKRSVPEHVTNRDDFESELHRFRREEAEQSARPAMRQKELEYKWTRFCFEVLRWTWAWEREQHDNQYRWQWFCFEVWRFAVAQKIDAQFVSAIEVGND